jgi:hypothetical protein
MGIRLKAAAATCVMAFALAGCAVIGTVPFARPLNDAQIAEIGETPVAASQNNEGVTKSWFMSTAATSAGASQGLIGVAVGVAIDAMINAGPAGRATKAADELSKLLATEDINASFIDALKKESAASAAQAGVRFGPINLVQKITAPDPLDDAIEVDILYVLSEDASTLRATAVVTYHNAKFPYVSRYTVAKDEQMPDGEKEGPVYRNIFSYYSTQIPAPTLTPDLKERLVASVQDSFRDAEGKLPAPKSEADRSMQREITAARDDDFTPDEISIFLTREWLSNNAAALRAEVANAHAFFARYILLDMNRTVLPSIGGRDEVLETLEGGRIVRRMGSGTEAGTYESRPGGVTTVVRFGNALKMSKLNEDRISEIRRQQQPQRRRQRR